MEIMPTQGPEETWSRKEHAVLQEVNENMTLTELARVMLEKNNPVVLVRAESGEPLGWIEAIDVLRGTMTGEGQTLRARDIYQPLVESDHVDPALDCEQIRQWFTRQHRALPYFISAQDRAGYLLSTAGLMEELAKQRDEEIARHQLTEKFFVELVELVPLGIVLFSEDEQIVYANTLAKKIIGGQEVSSDGLKSIVMPKVQPLLEGKNGRKYHVYVREIAGRTVNGKRKVLIFVDITSEHNLMKTLAQSRDEAELALAVLMPDLRVAARLRSVVEYMDEYDAASEKIRITGVISQGVYRHVINILKLLADTFQQGLMELPGLEKEVLVNAAIFHDLGKVQPDLKVGDLVRPEEVFEPGYLHAARGAALARGIYNLNPNTVVLIEYHHHAEEGLPGDFPAYLLPMYRFFRLIDGLSAGITRRKAEVKLRVDGSKIHVVENSPMPRYNRSFVLDLYSGSVT